VRWRASRSRARPGSMPRPAPERCVRPRRRAGVRGRPAPRRRWRHGRATGGWRRRAGRGPRGARDHATRGAHASSARHCRWCDGPPQGGLCPWEQIRTVSFQCERRGPARPSGERRAVVGGNCGRRRAVASAVRAGSDVGGRAAGRRACRGIGGGVVWRRCGRALRVGGCAPGVARIVPLPCHACRVARGLIVVENRRGDRLPRRPPG
jgi:hypothetical protein